MSPAQRKAIWERLGMKRRETATLSFDMIEKATDEAQDMFFNGIMGILAANGMDDIREVITG